MIVILKLVSFIFILTFALKPFEMMELTSEYLRLIPLKNRSDYTVKNMFMTLILTIRFIVLYTIFFYQIVNDYLQKYRLITQDQVTTIVTKQKDLQLTQKPTFSDSNTTIKNDNDSVDESIHLTPTLSSNNTTSSSASSIAEPNSIDSSADEQQNNDVLTINKDGQFKHSGNDVNTSINMNNLCSSLEETETPKLSTREESTVEQHKEEVKYENEREKEKEVEQVKIKEAEEEKPSVVEAIKEEVVEEEKPEEIKVIEAEKPKEIEEIKVVEEEKPKEIEQLKVAEVEAKENTKVGEKQEAKEAIEDKVNTIEKEEEEEESKNEKKAQLYPDNITQSAQVAQEEIDQVVEEFPMAPNNEPQQVVSSSLSSPQVPLPSNSLQISSLDSSSRRMSEGSATPALTSSSSGHGSPSSRRSSCTSSADIAPQPSKLLSKMKGTETHQQQQKQQTNHPLADRPPSRFLSLRIGGNNKNKPVPEEPPQPKVSMSSKLKSSFKFMKKVKASGKRASQILQ